jgi:hypothetical protein
VAELFALLAEPDRQGVLALADHQEVRTGGTSTGWATGVVTTVASLQHWASRLKMVASVAKCALGDRSLQVFRFRGPRCVGQRDARSEVEATPSAEISVEPFRPDPCYFLTRALCRFRRHALLDLGQRLSL